MTQVVINVEDPSILPSLRKILNSIEGVTVVPSPRKRKSGIEEAMEDIAAGRVYKADSVEDMFEQILGKRDVQSCFNCCRTLINL